MDDELGQRRREAQGLPASPARRLARKQGAAGMEGYRFAIAEQRKKPGAPNAEKWFKALYASKFDKNAAPTPGRITQALDLAGLEGPEVDEACGVEEPTVDLWETGEVIPTKEQLERLAFLTGVRPAFFYLPAPTLTPEGAFLCNGSPAREFEVTDPFLSDPPTLF